MKQTSSRSKTMRGDMANRSSRVSRVKVLNASKQYSLDTKTSKSKSKKVNDTVFKESNKQGRSGGLQMRRILPQKITRSQINSAFSHIFKQIILITSIWVVTYTLIFVVSYYKYLQHYLICPLTCGKGCLCLSAHPSHKAGVTVLWNQVRLVFEVEPIFNIVAMLLLSIAATFNIYLLYRIYIREKEIYAHTSALTLLFSTVGALFGGCISCNLALIYPFLSFFGLSGLILSLPFQGKEIVLLSAALLFVNAYYLLKRFKKGLVGRVSYNK